MDELIAFYGSNNSRRIVLEGAASGGRYSRPIALAKAETPRVAAYEPIPGTSYATEYSNQEQDDTQFVRV